MDITSIGFLVSLMLILGIYNLLPFRCRWRCLLAASLLFVGACQPLGLLFVGFSSWSVWYAAGKLEKNRADSGILRKKNRRLLLLTISGNLMILLVLKYMGDILGMLRGRENVFRFLIPIGLSYYTLQAIGYVMDVYWNRIPAENSYGKVLLFLTYFPQMLQGPISRYRELSAELTEKEHPFCARNLKFGIQRMLWGYFKVLGLSGFMGQFVTSAFYSGEPAYGLSAFLGLVFFGFQLYANFSGGMDIVIGASQCFGIELPENFRQPFFSRSLGEFWRRWHITLGTWMKDYVFFPFSMSSPVKNLKKKLKKKISRKTANRIPIAMANLVVFLLVGIWHGTGTNYALWGLYNGLILACSELMTDTFLKTKQKLHIREDGLFWSSFCYLRTFVIITLGWCTDCASTAAGSLQILRNMLEMGRTNLYIFGIGKLAMVQIAVFLGILLTVEILHEKKKSFREMMERKSIALQMIFWVIFIQLCIFLGNMGVDGGLMYANF